MKPEEADYVMRIMKKQGLSAGLAAFGWFGYKQFGGYKNTAIKKKEDDLNPNDVMIYGEKMPHIMTHTPWFTTLQTFATLHYAYDDYKQNSNVSAENAAGNAGLSVAKGFGELTPYYSAPKDILRGTESYSSASDFLGGILRSFVIPPDVKNVAEHMDTDENGEPIKRSPKSMLQQITVGIPGLRENVPLKTPHPDFDKIQVGDKAYHLNNEQMQQRQKFYDDFMKSDGAKELKLTIAKTTNKIEKKKLETRLKTMASKVSKLKVLGKYHNAETGGYDLEKVEE